MSYSCYKEISPIEIYSLGPNLWISNGNTDMDQKTKKLSSELWVPNDFLSSLLILFGTAKALI
jgi:hypothetical protein